MSSSGQIDKYLDLVWKEKKLYDMKVTGIPIVVGAQRLEKEIRVIGGGMKNRNHSDNNNFESGLNIQKDPVIQTSVKTGVKNGHLVIISAETLMTIRKPTEQYPENKNGKKKQLYGRFKRLISNISHKHGRD